MTPLFQSGPSGSSLGALLPGARQLPLRVTHVTRSLLHRVNLDSTSDLLHNMLVPDAQQLPIGAVGIA